MRPNKAVYPAIDGIAVIYSVVIATIACQALLLSDVWPSTLNSATHSFRSTAIWS